MFLFTLVHANLLTCDSPPRIPFTRDTLLASLSLSFRLSSSAAKTLRSITMLSMRSTPIVGTRRLLPMLPNGSRLSTAASDSSRHFLSTLQHTIHWISKFFSCLSLLRFPLCQQFLGPTFCFNTRLDFILKKASPFRCSLSTAISSIDCIDISPLRFRYRWLSMAPSFRLSYCR